MKRPSDPPPASSATATSSHGPTRAAGSASPLPSGELEARVDAHTKRRRRTALVVLAPIVSVATLMLGLRVGAGEAVRAATVFGAPPGKPPGPHAPTPLAWQVLTYLEDRGVREAVAVGGLTVVARSKGKEARWTGASNTDGVAEASLAIADLAPGDPLHVEVRAASETEPLAEGEVDWQAVAWSPPGDDAGERSAARPSKREGPIGIDLVVEGQRLAVGFETPIWARVAAPGLAPERVTLSVDPEPGLSIDSVGAVACEGWSELRAIARAHVVGLRVEAKGSDERTGVWFGALPIAPGAFFVDVPRFVPEGTSATATIVAPNPRDVVYAEIDDERGRVFAAALALHTDPSDPVPRASFSAPALSPGLHWIVVSGEPRGAERLAGAAIARPFLVGGAPGVRPEQPCSVGPWLARHPATGFPRWIALDGMATRGAGNRARHRAGLAIGLASLLAAAVLELLLLTAAAREARAAMLLAEIDGPPIERECVTAKPPGGGLAVALLVAMLGFALLAALMIAKG